MNTRMRTEKPDVYLTKDLYVASLLYCFSKKLIRLSPIENFYWFVFEAREECDTLIRKYYRKEISVDAKSYVEAIFAIKDRLFEAKGHKPSKDGA